LDVDEDDGNVRLVFPIKGKRFFAVPSKENGYPRFPQSDSKHGEKRLLVLHDEYGRVGNDGILPEWTIQCLAIGETSPIGQ
jgi:hypothetical protein